MMKKIIAVFGLCMFTFAPLALAEGGVNIVDDNSGVVLTDTPTPVPVMEVDNSSSNGISVTDVKTAESNNSLGSILDWASIVVSILLVLLILTQERGGGLSSTFGGSGGFYASKRGMEKTLYRGTVLLALLFAVLNLMAMWV